jgi:rhodanese-related sulfurtransferase
VGKDWVGPMSFYKTNEEQELITVEEFVNEWYDKGEYIFVDIREPDEIISDGGVKNSYNISMYDIPDQIEMAPTYIVCILICNSGARSEQVVKYLKNNEFNNMFAIDGGYDALIAALPELKA